eukprot:3325039-Rhodomonas_salina.1
MLVHLRLGSGRVYLDRDLAALPRRPAPQQLQHLSRASEGQQCQRQRARVSVEAGADDVRARRRGGGGWTRRAARKEWAQGEEATTQRESARESECTSADRESSRALCC